MQQLGDFIRGLDVVLDDDGWFCFENHYLGAILESSQYDSIYHEHIFYFTLNYKLITTTQKKII